MSHKARSAAARARKHPSPRREDGDLRASLRHVPILPAPTDVEELVARLEAEDVVLDSGPLADIISDARAPDVAPASDENGGYDPFFAPLAEVANSNVPQPVAPRQALHVSRLSAVLFAVALIGGIVIILWNALIVPDALPPLTPTSTERPAPPIAAAAPEPDLEPLPAQPVLAELLPPIEVPAAALEPAPVEPTMPPKPPAAEVAAASDGQATAALVQPQPPAEAEVAAALVQSEPVSEPATASPPAPSEPLTASAMAPAVAEPAPAPEAASAEDAAPSAVSIDLPEPAPPLAPEIIMAMLQPPAQPSSETGPAPAPEATTDAAPAGPPSSGALEVTVTAPKPTARPKSPAPAPFAGVWAESAATCSPATREEGALLAYINGRRGRAGDTICTFRRLQRTGRATWQIAAACADPQTTWNSDVQLSLKGRQLTWSSQKGSVTYVRCRRS
jgi:hypothetical protein